MLESKRVRDIHKVVHAVERSRKFCDNSLVFYTITGAISIDDLTEKLIDGDVEIQTVVDELKSEYECTKDLLERDQRILDSQCDILQQLPKEYLD